MKYAKDAALESARMISSRTAIKPTVGILAGTGLGASADIICEPIEIKYNDIPNFPLSTVQSHHGELVLGSIGKTPTIAFMGRFHLYEGYSPAAVTFPIRVMQALGVKTLFICNAAGGLNPHYRPGEIMAISDHINLTGKNPLTGPNEEKWGIRFPDMAKAYAPHLIALCHQTAENAGQHIEQGIYAGLPGPSLETVAEARYLKIIGADAVGFSTVLEVIAAIHAKMQVVGLSIITNVHNQNNPMPATVDEIIGVAEEATPLVATIVSGVINML